MTKTNSFFGKICRVLLLTMLLIGISSCSESVDEYQQTTYVFGTRVELSIFSKNEARAQQAAALVFANLDRLNTKLHTWHTNSQLYQLNQKLAKGKHVQVDAEMAGLIKQSQRFSKMSDGLFDPALGGLVALWGFHADSYVSKLPSAEKFARFVSNMPNMNDLHWQGSKLSSSNHNLALDFGGIAKGWALDLSRNILIKNGIKSALINIGGNIIALGTHPDGRAWEVGIQNPRKESAMAKIKLNDGEAIGTSGDYRRYFRVKGANHCHLIDPRDGSSSCNKHEVTVLMPPSNEAGIRSDALSKPLYFAKETDVGKYLQRFATPYALIIDGQGVAWVTPEMNKRLVWLETPPQVKMLKVETNAAKNNANK